MLNDELLGCQSSSSLPDSWHKSYNTFIMAAENSPTGHLYDNSLDARVVSPLSIAIAFMIGLDYLHGNTFTKSPVLVVITMLTIGMFALAHFVPRLIFSKHHTFYLCAYYLVLSLVLIFVSPTLSYYLAIWVPLAYLAEYYYQIKGIVINLTGLLLVLVVGTIYQADHFKINMLVEILPYFLIVTGITLFLNRLILGNRKERADIAEKMLRAQYEHERLIALINSMTEAVLAVDESGKITIYNAAALDLLDTNIELNNQDISRFVKLRDSNGDEVSIMQLAADTHYLSQRTDLVMPVGANDQLNLEINISRTSLVAPLAKQQGYTFLLRDITQQKSLDVERDEFISVVSHELRTPITVAEANISMAQLTSSKPDFNVKDIISALDKAHRQVLFLSEMVNDLSTLSRAERTDKEMAIEAFNLGEIIDELDKTYGPQAHKKGLKLVIEADAELPMINSSRLYVKEIIQNFVTNAIKYTEKGSVTILAHSIDRHNFRLSVQDSGIGIAKSEQDKVFQKFWRSEDPYTRQNNGTGLGLYITAKLARRIGAKIEMTSKLKVGTTFSLILPIVAALPIDQKSVVHNEIEHMLE